MFYYHTVSANEHIISPKLQLEAPSSTAAPTLRLDDTGRGQMKDGKMEREKMDW